MPFVNPLNGVPVTGVADAHARSTDSVAFTMPFLKTPKYVRHVHGCTDVARRISTASISSNTAQLYQILYLEYNVNKQPALLLRAAEFARLSADRSVSHNT